MSQVVRTQQYRTQLTLQEGRTQKVDKWLIYFWIVVSVIKKIKQGKE